MTNPTAAAPEPYLCGGERAAAHGAHYIEETVRVYLMRDLAGTDTWVIDPTCFGDALPSEYDDPQNSECRCETPDECADIVGRMDKVGLPDGEDLMFMLAAALGYTLTQTDA